MKPVLPLTDAEMAFWPVLSRSRKIVWNKNLNALACITCRDLGTIVEISASGCGEDQLAELCKRTHYGLKLLRVCEIKGDSIWHRIVKQFQTAD